jgi:hypothetical protein
METETAEMMEMLGRREENAVFTALFDEMPRRARARSGSQAASL